MSEHEECVPVDAPQPQGCQPHTCTFIVEELVAVTDDAAWDEAE